MINATGAMKMSADVELSQDGSRHATRTRHTESIVMLLENNPYPQDVRVRSEAESLAAAGHDVTVLAPRGAGQRRREILWASQ